MTDPGAGVPNGNPVQDAASMGIAGVLVLSFGFPLTGSGDSSPDIWVWEVGFAPEPYRVEVSNDLVNWRIIREAVLTDGNGSEGFDVDAAGIGQASSFSYVRITDLQTETPATFDNCTAGSDIDAVAILSNPPRVPTAGPYALTLLVVMLLIVSMGALRRRIPGVS